MFYIIYIIVSYLLLNYMFLYIFYSCVQRWDIQIPLCTKTLSCNYIDALLHSGETQLNQALSPKSHQPFQKTSLSTDWREWKHRLSLLTCWAVTAVQQRGDLATAPPLPAPAPFPLQSCGAFLLITVNTETLFLHQHHRLWTDHP